MEIISDDLRQIKITLPKSTVRGIKECAARDSRDEDHIFNVALEKYIKERKI